MKCHWFAVFFSFALGLPAVVLFGWFFFRALGRRIDAYWNWVDSLHLSTPWSIILAVIAPVGIILGAILASVVCLMP